MVTLGSGDYIYEPVEDWAKLRTFPKQPRPDNLRSLRKFRKVA
jgi:hypothetical protein